MHNSENLKLNFIAKLNKYTKIYDNVFVIFFKMMFYLFTQCLSLPSHFGKGKIQKLPQKYLRIAIRFDGGLGDILVYSVWAKEFSKMLNCDFMIDVFPSKNLGIANATYQKDSFIHNVYEFGLFDDNYCHYDMAISFRRFPYFVHINKKKIKQLAPELISFIQHYQEFKNRYIKFFVYSASLDTLIDLYSICRGEKRIQQPDIDNLLGITENKTKMYCAIDPQAFGILDEYGLKDSKYITITRSVELKQNHADNIRLWSIDYYKSLINMLKNKYPDIKIVQLGVPRCEVLPDIDIDLRGKTNLEQLKVVVKHSLLHIDGECGMVHLKHFLYGKSAVIFGQTAIEYLGYDNNINLKSDACNHWCEWIADDWQNNCIRGYKNPPCMTELKPEYVFENITPYIDSVLNKPQKTIEVIETNDINGYFAQNDVNNKKIIFFGKDFYDTALKVKTPNNYVTLYDQKLENSKIKKAQDYGVLVEYGDIFNIPETDDYCDLFIINKKALESNKDFALKEITRVSSKLIIGV